MLVLLLKLEVLAAKLKAFALETKSFFLSTKTFCELSLDVEGGGGTPLNETGSTRHSVSAFTILKH